MTVSTNKIQRYQQVESVEHGSRTKRTRMMAVRQVTQCSCPFLSTRRRPTICAVLKGWSGWSSSHSYSSALSCCLSVPLVRLGVCTEVAATVNKGAVRDQVGSLTWTAAATHAWVIGRGKGLSAEAMAAFRPLRLRQAEGVDTQGTQPASTALYQHRTLDQCSCDTTS